MIRLYSPIIILVLVLNGCGYKQPWSDPLAENEEESLRKELISWQQRDCPAFINAELTAKWDSRLADGGLTGYLQLLLPSAIKMVAINPLGQPLFAIAIKENSFQAVNVTKGVYKHGRLSHFLERYNLPTDTTMQVNWAQWLAGTAFFTDAELAKTSYDKENRGIWLTVIKQNGLTREKEFLLYHPTSQRILRRIVMDTSGREMVSIGYDNWSVTTPCPLPQHITVEGKALGSAIDIQLSDILTEESYPEKKFTIRKPPNYLRQYYP